MKLFFFILSFLICLNACTPEKTGYEDSSASTLSDADRINNLETRVSKLEVRVSKSEADSVYQAKQILALKKNDSIYNLRVNSEASKQKDLIYRVSVDSINQWKKINLVYPLVSIFPKDSLKQWQAINSASAIIPKVSFLTTRFTGDSVKQWNTIKTVTPLIPKVASLKTDSAKQWVEINKLKSASPVTQIPVLQADIKAIQSKNVSQDKVIVAHTSSIKNIEDTLNVYKRVASSDFGVDARGYFKISQAGMERIKINTQPQP